MTLILKNILRMLALGGVLAALAGCHSKDNYGVGGDDPFGVTAPTDRTVTSGGTTTRMTTSGGFNFITGGSPSNSGKNP